MRPSIQHHIRNLLADDFDQISSVVDDWWGGRPVRTLIPRLFFEHFSSTSFAIGASGEVIGFLIGFVSPSIRDSAYIHFVGVDPAYRGQGLARKLYEAFFDAVAAADCKEIQCITSPVNSGSIAFHASMGFELLPGTGRVEEVPVILDYAAPGQHRVRFRKLIGNVTHRT